MIEQDPFMLSLSKHVPLFFTSLLKIDHRTLRALAFALALVGLAVTQQSSQSEETPSGQISLGAEIYARNCSPCHGARMLDAQGAFDLRQFPRDQKSRFVTAVTKGKNTMPPWGDLLKPEDIDALWAYVLSGRSS